MLSLTLLTVAVTVCIYKSKLLYTYGCERYRDIFISHVISEIKSSSSWPETDFPGRRVLQYEVENQTIDTPRAGGQQMFYSVCISEHFKSHIYI